MCGRYTYKLTWEQIVNLYRLTLPEHPPEKHHRSRADQGDAIGMLTPGGTGSDPDEHVGHEHHDGDRPENDVPRRAPL